MDTLFQHALACHRAGDLAAAERLYGELLAVEPRHAEALHLLGVLMHQSGRHEPALALIDRAVALAPSAAAFSNRASVLRALGRLEDALPSHDEALRRAPNLAPAHANKAEILLELGRPEEALACYDQALALRPRDATALANRGVALEALGRPDDAVASYDLALALRPDARTHANRGNALHKLGRHDEAVESYARAIALGLDDPELWFTQGNALLELDRPEESLASYDRALALRPDYVEAWNNRGNALRALARYEAAIASYAHALALDPGSHQARVNTGNVLQIINRHDKALAYYDAVLADDPDHADAHWNGSMCRLALGDFEQGWRDFEWRFQVAPARDYAEPLWLGQEIPAGATVLLHAEQGFGDTLQFCRYAPMVTALGARVVIETQPALKRLLTTLDGVARVVAQGEATGPFDLQCPLLSLPLAFGTRVDTVPAKVPYLRADPQASAAWRARLAALPGVKVGLVWAGNPRSFNRIAAETDRRRSITLDHYAPLAAIPGVTLVSLQKDAAGEQARHPPAGMVIHDWTEELADFADTAALVAALDLVIGVDTSVVHVAGALGKPVWILNRLGACWRWMRERTDTPWYPNARLFRQQRPGDWGPVIQEVCATLPEFVAAASLHATPAMNDAS